MYSVADYPEEERAPHKLHCCQVDNKLNKMRVTDFYFAYDIPQSRIHRHFSEREALVGVHGDYTPAPTPSDTDGSSSAK